MSFRPSGFITVGVKSFIGFGKCVFFYENTFCTSTIFLSTPPFLCGQKCQRYALLPNTERKWRQKNFSSVASNGFPKNGKIAVVLVVIFPFSSFHINPLSIISFTSHTLLASLMSYFSTPYSKRNPLRFHTPGFRKLGRVTFPGFQADFSRGGGRALGMFFRGEITIRQSQITPFGGGIGGFFILNPRKKVREILKGNTFGPNTHTPDKQMARKHNVNNHFLSLRARLPKKMAFYHENSDASALPVSLSSTFPLSILF